MAGIGMLGVFVGIFSFCSRSSGGRAVLITRPNLVSRYCILYVPAHAFYRLAEMLTDSTLFHLEIMNRIMIKTAR